MILPLNQIVIDFATAIKAVDRQGPVAKNSRTGKQFQPGIGPHSEAATVELVVNELRHRRRSSYKSVETDVPYGDDSRSRLDVLIQGEGASWAFEVKMLRMLGDNGKPNDNMLMHILSPYDSDRSALTDCKKVLGFGGVTHRGLIIYGYDSSRYPIEVAIRAFESIARIGNRIGPRSESRFSNLMHPVHASGAVYGWQITETNSAEAS